MCRHSCPVSAASGNESLIPQAKMDRLNQVRKGNLPWTADNLDSIWACTGCRHCTVYCHHDNEPGLVLFGGRAAAQAQGVAHPALADYVERFRARDEQHVASLRQAVPAERRADDAVVGYWPGCDALDAADVGGALASALGVIERVSGVSLKIVDIGQACAGSPLLAAGEPDAFRWHAGKVARGLKQFRTVVVGCSTCIYTLRSAYPAEGLPLATEIVSVPEFMARSLAGLPERSPKKPVYYHDPCALARQVGVIEEPRKLLAQVAEVRELGWSGTDTECCGAAGLLPETMPDVADEMARRRLREVVRGGGGTVVTSCPSCARMLRRNAPDGVEVSDLPGFLAQSMRDADRALASGDEDGAGGDR